MTFSSYLKKNITRSLIVIMLIVLIIVNLAVRFFFNTYLDRKVNENNQTIIGTILELDHSGELTFSNLEALSATNTAYIILYQDETVIFETNTTGNGASGLGNASGRGMMSRMMNFSSLQKDFLTFYEYPITQNATLTKIEIGRNLNILSGSDEGSFIFAINAMVIIAFVLSYLMMRYLSDRLAKKLSDPIEQLSDQVKSIASHHTFEKDGPLPFSEFEMLSLTLEDLNHKLEVQESLRKRLTSDLAHELKNPLAILSSHIEAFTDGVWQPTTERLQNCGLEIVRLTRLIDDLSELAALEGKMTMSLNDVNLSHLITETAMQFQSIADEKGISINLEVISNITFRLDDMRMKQVIINLISNAIKYAHEQGQVTVKLAYATDGYTLSVEDDGIGISEINLPHIFERFYRADTLRGKSTGGLGIGLSIVKAICDAHHFTLSAESELGVGTKIKIFMPL